MNKIIIFDMDGTLINSRKDITSSINYVRKSKNMSPLSEEFVSVAINSKRSELSKILYKTENYLDSDRKLFEEHYITECVKNSHLYTGIKNSLDSFKKENFSMSVATNAPTKYALKMLSHLEVDHYFDHIIGACKVETPKPDPEMLNLILNNYGYDNNKCKATMVGDSHVDINAGKNANINTVFVKWGFGDSDNTEDISLNSPEQLKKITSLYGNC